MNCLRRVAAAAAFVSLSAIAEPSFAAPPTDVAAPIEAPAAPEASVWSALIDHRVVFTLAEGGAVACTVLSVTDQSVVCARHGDGLMVVVDVEQISFVNVVALPGNKPLKKPETGQGLIVFGGIWTAIGSGLIVASLATGTACYDSGGGFCAWISGPIGAAGMAGMSFGIPLLSSGLRKRKAFRAALAAPAPTFSAFVAPGRTGSMAGFGIRF